MDPELEVRRIDIASEVLRDSGRLRIRALGASMIPTIWPGDVITINNCEHRQIQNGSIALFSRRGEFVVHRINGKIHSMNEVQWISRGDATAEEDPPWSDRELLGLVSKIERRGRAFAPKQNASSLVRASAWLVCRSNLCRNLSLRIHSFLSNRGPDHRIPSEEARPGRRNHPYL